MPKAKADAASPVPADPSDWRFSWHEPAWARLQEQISIGRLPHAMLLKGLPGVGKHALALRLSMRLLCPEAAGDACGQCRSCRQFLAGTHPDFHQVGLLEGKSQIVVDQIRDSLVEALHLSAQYGARKVAIIDPADRMNRSSFNALLKTLEEPSGDAVLLLVSAHPARLAPTIRSRCQNLAVPTPNHETGSAWLRSQGIDRPDALLGLSGGAPLAALALAGSEALSARDTLLPQTLDLLAGNGDPASVAAGWAKLPMATGIAWLQSLLHDLIRLRQLGSGAALVNVDRRQDLQSAAHRLDWRSMHWHLDELARMRALAEAPLAAPLQWEAVMFTWLGRFVPRQSH